MQAKKKKLQTKLKAQTKLIEKEKKENSKKIQKLQKKLNGDNTPVTPAPKKIVLKKAKAPKKEVHPFATCDGCKVCPIIGKRYKCKENPNIDLCEKCFRKNNKSNGLKFEVVDTQKIMKQVILKASANRINTVSCEGCGMNPIEGERFKCSVCHNFNYCKNCEQMYKNMHGHPLVEVKPKNI